MAKLGSWLFVAATTLSVAIHVGMKAAGFLRQAAFARKIGEIEGVAASYITSLLSAKWPPNLRPQRVDRRIHSLPAGDGMVYLIRETGTAVVLLLAYGGLSRSATGERVQSAGSRYRLLIAPGIVLILPAKRALDDWVSTRSKLETQLFVLLL